MAPHSSTLAWKIPWMEEPGGLQSIGRWYMFVVISFAILDAESAVNSVLSAFYAHLEI